jgi:hypothetical protein
MMSFLFSRAAQLKLCSATISYITRLTSFAAAHALGKPYLLGVRQQIRPASPAEIRG